MRSNSARIAAVVAICHLCLACKSDRATLAAETTFSAIEKPSQVVLDNYDAATRLAMTRVNAFCYQRDDQSCEFRRFEHAEILPEGGVILADQSSSVREFTTRGEFVRSFGRRGAGPGEMQVIGGVSVLEDHTVVVLDVAGFRLLRFSSDGSPLSTRNGTFLDGTVDVRLSRGNYATMMVPAADSVGARVIARIIGRQSERDSISLAMFTIGALSRRGSTGVATRPPFTPDLLWAYNGDSTVVLSGGQDFDFLIYRAGDPAVLVKSTQRAITVSSHDRDSAAFARRNPGGRPSNAPGYNDFVEDQIRRMPSMRPVIAAILIDSNGSIWIRSAVEQPLDSLGRRQSRWDVFDGGGHRRGYVRLPATARILRASADLIAVAETEEIGREFVVVYRLDAPLR